MSRLFRYTIRVSGTVTAIGAIATAACYYDFQREYSPPHIWSTKPHKYSLSDVLAQCKPNPNATTHLSPSQVEQYNRDGYVVARNVIPVSLYYASKYQLKTILKTMSAGSLRCFPETHSAFTLQLLSI
eukprot:155201_1